MSAILLLIIGVFLIAININAIKKEKTGFSAVLDHSQNNLKDYDVEIGKLRKEFAETVLELQKEIESLKYGTSTIEDDIGIEGNGEEEKITININEDLVQKDNLILNKSIDEYENNSGDNNFNENIDVNKSSIINYLIDDASEEVLYTTNESSSANYNNIKVDEIRKLLDNGLSVDEISEKIGIGKGEILLIKELYIK